MNPACLRSSQYCTKNCFTSSMLFLQKLFNKKKKEGLSAISLSPPCIKLKINYKSSLGGHMLFELNYILYVSLLEHVILMPRRNHIDTRPIIKNSVTNYTESPMNFKFCNLVACHKIKMKYIRRKKIVLQAH